MDQVYMTSSWSMNDKTDALNTEVFGPRCG